LATILEVYRDVFPDQSRQSGLGSVPRLPTDVFAFAAHLIERSGAYHHISPEVRGPVPNNFRRIVVGDVQRARGVDIGQAWRNGAVEAGARLPSPPIEVEQLWMRLEGFRDEPVFEPIDDTAAAPAWWTICLELVMITDEACRGMGFQTANPFFDFIMEEYAATDLSSGKEFRRVQRAPFSLSSAAEELLCVQAKARTPSVGCTLRSLTHNLALLPPRGQVRARWVAPVIEADEQRLQEDLGLLLVPLPYDIDDQVFRPAGEAADGHWGWFDVVQNWLPASSTSSRKNKLVEFILDLIRTARASGARVDAVVLPELALDFANFRALARALASDRAIDFLISGISTDARDRKGNFVAIAPFFLLGKERDEKITAWENLILVREKHHRWKLNGAQLQDYGLTGLDQNKSWWERLDILSRSLDLLVYRGKSTLTTLICEDLARVDPCQAVVRAVGPNLLIALLMDGPQIGERWPGRYATVLAEDPGTSVLSLTSFGLMARQNRLGAFGQSSSIALWKDEKNGPKNLELDRNAEAMVLEIAPKFKEERTLDGRRDDGSSLRWEYKRHVQVSTGFRAEISLLS
jgi:hypothetical protein